MSRRTVGGGTGQARRGRFRRHSTRRRTAPRTAPRAIRLAAGAATVTALAGVLIGVLNDRPYPRGAGAFASQMIPTPVPTPPAATAGPTAPRPTATMTPPATTPAIPDSGPGSFDLAAGALPDPVGAGRRVHYTVEVEDGAPFDPGEVAAVVDATLADPRGWAATEDVSFERVTSDEDVRVLVATPQTTDTLCAPLRTAGEVSCRNGTNVVVNAKRWAYGVPHYNGDLDAYRQYVINHEMGHAIGNGHEECPGPGETAPVMQQQTYGLDGCRPNPWPDP